MAGMLIPTPGSRFPAGRLAPPAFRTQYQFDRSPRSSDRQFLTFNFFDLSCAAAVLIFFIAGLLYLLYLLRFERVDNLGAYRIPSETGLLIPSVYNSAV
jgi:hypothetical protein